VKPTLCSACWKPATIPAAESSSVPSMSKMTAEIPPGGSGVQPLS
jgi:hypothetical protein